MAYVKIEADEKRTKVDMEGTPLSLMGIIGTAMEECLATIVADLPALGQRASVQGFCETLQLQVMRKLGGGKETDKASEGKEAPPKQEKPKKPTPEEVLEMVDKLSSEDLRKLLDLQKQKLDLQMQKMVNSLWAKDQPKQPEEKEPAVGYGVLL